MVLIIFCFMSSMSTDRKTTGRKTTSYLQDMFWLPHGQLWAIIEEAAALTRCYLLRFHFRPEGPKEPRNEVRSLSRVERLVVFEPGTFRFWFQRLNTLGHFPLRESVKATASYR